MGRLALSLACCFISWAALAQGSGWVVTVSNDLNIARPSETVVLDAQEFRKIDPKIDLRTIHAVDMNGDAVWDQLLFQADLGPNETRRFHLTVGERQMATKEQYKAYGRFVR